MPKMKEREIQAFYSTLKVQGTPKELREKFPCTITERHVTILYKGNIIWYEKLQEFDKRWSLLKGLEATIPDLTLVLEKKVKPLETLIHLDDFHADLLDPGDGTTQVKVTTYANDPEAHYKKLEQVKELLAQAGFPPIGSFCQVEIRQTC